MSRLTRPALTALCILGLQVAIPTPRAAAQEQSVVRAVLFFSPTCPHCHQVINEDLPVIFDIHGGPPQVWYDQTVPPAERTFYYITNGKVEVLLVDVSKPAGSPLYYQSTTRFQVPQPRSGVPRLIVGDSVLVGSVEIPQIFPQMIRQGLAADGIDWPAIEGLESAIPAVPEPTADTQPSQPIERSDTAATTQAADTAEEQPETPEPPVTVAADSGVAEPVTQTPDTTITPVAATLEDIPVGRVSMFDTFQRDPVGNGAAVLILVLMILSVLFVGRFAPEWTDRKQLGIAIPVLAVLGIVVAGYLTYVETSGALAVCGPVGDCNAVQQSPYAKLFGLIPVGLLGLVSYVTIVAAWLVTRNMEERVSDWAQLAILAIAFVGIMFSIYLTFLEPFVIGATCMWCLTSSVLITALLWLAAAPGTAAWARITNADLPPASETP